MKSKLVSAAVGTAMGITLTSGIASADINPFEIIKLDSGYSVAMSDTPDEAKCGADKAKSEAKCGGDKAATEAKCGGNKNPEAKCGAK